MQGREQQRKKGRKIFRDGKLAVYGEEGKGGKYLEMENLSSECCKTLKFFNDSSQSLWESDLWTPILALWLEYLAASGVVAVLLIHLQLFGALVLYIFERHLKVECRFVPQFTNSAVIFFEHSLKIRFPRKTAVLLFFCPNHLLPPPSP